MRCKSRVRNLCLACFGIGLALSCFCPTGLILFISGTIIIVLGISCFKR